ncbi:HNH endonuclease [Arthrobacter sp. UYCu712]|uniref:HNH endonuclease n=1 Tax=Arthrobacter sp. UYCu712 TaxID=3156340 RepID=UPI003399B2AB
MTAIILVWNPGHWNAWTYPEVVEQVAETGRFLATWSVGAQADIPSGADAWLLFQGRRGGGLIGHGVVVSEHPGDDSPLNIRVAFDALLPAGDHIEAGMLAEAVPGVEWDILHDSGLTVDPADEPRLRALWQSSGPAAGADPTQPVPGTFPDEAVSRVAVNRYERSADARRACIAHHGTRCAACGFSFESAYGEPGRDFIQVHHVVPVSQLGSGYQLDPVTDLVPLCANCHAMAHHGVRTPRTVAELRRILGTAGYLAGQTLSPEELEAQRDARRILEQH